MNTKDTGDRSVAIILAKLIEYGYFVLIPFGDNRRYDLAVDLGGKFIRIQCKTAWKKDDCIIFSTRSVCYGRGGKWVTKEYTKDDIDVFMVYSPDLGRIFITPVETKTEMKLRLFPAKIRDTKVRLAKDYEFNGAMPEWIKGTLC